MKTKLSDDLTHRDEILDMVSRLQGLRSSLAWVQDTVGQVQRAHARVQEGAAVARLGATLAVLDNIDTALNSLIMDYAKVLVHTGPEQ